MHSHSCPHRSPEGQTALRATRVDARGFAADAGPVLARLVRDTQRADGTDIRYAFWLDSASAGRSGGAAARWSVLGIASEVLRCDDAEGPDPRVVVLGPDGALRRSRAGTIFDALEESLRPRSQAPILAAEEPVPSRVLAWSDAWFGFFGYEVKAVVGAPNTHRADTPDAVWMSSDRLVAIDHHAGDAWIVGDRDWTERALEAIRAPREPLAPGADAVPELPRPDAASYRRSVEAALEEIREGNSYEVCLTAEARGILRRPWGFRAALEMYRAQRLGNPAPHAAFLWCDDVAVLSSSPERFVAVDENGWCEAKPIKGTVSRSPDPARDAAAARWLSGDPKTRAENLMIVDLMRNDFSKVCDPGSIRVPVLMGIESYATVHQLVSTVRGRLARGRTVIDLVKAAFPGGSMTGAPKPSTLQIIDRLEGRARGIYSGALGVLSPRGGDLSIVIRTAVLTPGPDGESIRLSVGAGGAIVADSDPEAEYEEMLLKLAAPLRRTSARSRGTHHDAS